MAPTPPITGAEVIAAHVKILPQTPGVYRMLDAKGAALYVGKARNLARRVRAYTRPEKHSVRIQRMIAQTAAMEFTATETEAEALLLEASLIKSLSPRYNILLRDDKSFPYIRITAHDYPRITKHRGARGGEGEYFGPFASGLAVNETLTVLQKGFQLRNCSDHVFALRTRPCLQYQIRRCTAPCVGKATKEEYAAQVDMARRFLQGRSREIQEDFAQKMQAASDAMDFESAAFYRDRIRALTQVQARQMVYVEGLENTDIHALAQKDGMACVQVFFFRAGRNYGNRAYFPRHERGEPPENILSAFLGQFYAARPVPREILLSYAAAGMGVIAEALRLKAGHAVALAVPRRGGKAELLRMALSNAQKALAHKRAADADHAGMLARLAEVFGLDAPPARVEVYDNSHVSGTHAVGAMIVADEEGLRRNAYRRFNMKRAAPGDDYGMMREMLSRRLSALARDGDAQRPDLLLIDGGRGQLSAALSVMADLGVSDIPVIAIAKGADRNAGRETFFVPDGREPFSLPPGDPLLHFLQRLRDEAHRFAITSHRAKRSRALSASPLDDIPGIGGKRKKALLVHFGSAKSVAAAGVADLQKVAGISRAAAERIYRFFHEDDQRTQE